MIEGESAVSAENMAEEHEAPATGEPQAAGEQLAGAANADSAAAAPEAPAVAPAPEAAASEAPASDGAAASADAAPAESGDEFMRDLVAAMRSVAEEARQTGVTELQTRADEQVRLLESDAELRQAELRRLADVDVAGVGEWAATEAERIKQEAEQRVVARRARLDQELAADGSRTEAEAMSVRDRVAEYERELEAYHAQLGEINDPAAFAAAAKRLPKPPALGGSAAAAATPAASSSDATVETAVASPVADPASSNGVPAEPDAPSTEVLASRMAELDAALPDGDTPAEAEVATAPEATSEASPPPAAAEADAPAAAPEADAAPAAVEQATSAEPTVTEVVVKGLGSFGAITGFRQSLSGVDGIDSVALSLGQTGEFVFRATHAAGFDVRAAIAALEGDGASIEARPEGGLRVTLEKAR